MKDVHRWKLFRFEYDASFCLVWDFPGKSFIYSNLKVLVDLKPNLFSPYHNMHNKVICAFQKTCCNKGKSHSVLQYNTRRFCELLQKNWASLMLCLKAMMGRYSLTQLADEQGCPECWEDAMQCMLFISSSEDLFSYLLLGGVQSPSEQKLSYEYGIINFWHLMAWLLWMFLVSIYISLQYSCLQLALPFSA